MTTYVNNIEDLISENTKHIDCYISTDGGEVDEILGNLGYWVNYSDESFDKPFFKNFLDNDNLMGYLDSLKHQKTGLEIDCADLSIKESLQEKERIGFIPMSLFRIYTNGSNNSVKIITPIIKAFDEIRQNMTFLDDRGSKVYQRFSEYYC